jgi:hypothetical protein
MAKKKTTAKKRGTRKTAKPKSSTKKSPKRKKKRTEKWAHKITTDSTHPPAGLFTKDADTIAGAMASKKVSPGGIGSGVKMVQMYINRAGENLEPKQKQELEKAKRKLQGKMRESK